MQAKILTEGIFMFRILLISTIFLIQLVTFPAHSQNARSIFSSGQGVVFYTEAPQDGESTEGSDILSDNELIDQSSEPEKLSAVEVEKDEGDSKQVEITTDEDIVVEMQPSEVAIQQSKIQIEAKVSVEDREVFSDNETVDYAGLSYTILKESVAGKFGKVNPGQTFKTGDRIIVEIISNRAATLITGNIDPLGKTTLISVDGVLQGQKTRIPQNGALKFVGPKGNEKLVFVLSADPISQNSENRYKKLITQCKSKPSTRSLIVDDTAGNEFQLINDDGSCPTSSNAKANTRSIIVDLSDNSGFGVTPQKTLESGQVLSLIVNLNHE